MTDEKEFDEKVSSYGAYRQAQQELKNEAFRELVEREKLRLREKAKNRKWWHKFVPFVVKIERRK